ncbi:hypothetical protein C4J94_0209 [Pseudomonas sp. R5-89-07]|nr:hypothetical protein C4J94_0209 [Pseudomonas sp. R5-89-07]
MKTLNTINSQFNSFWNYASQTAGCSGLCINNIENILRMHWMRAGRGL